MLAKRQRSIAAHEAALASLFGRDADTPQDSASFWAAKTTELEKYEDVARDVVYGEREFLTLKEQEGELEKQIDLANLELASLQGAMRQIEQQANQVLHLEDDYRHCDTLADVVALKDSLQQFIRDKTRNREIAHRCVDIFDAIEAEEQARVSELFGEDSAATQHFKEITNGRYEEVLFDQGAGGIIRVRRNDGMLLGADKLSGGAYDQLYLSIRLALGARLLKGDTGFFVMDDPFVKADPQRLERLLQTLRKIAALGWQILYFTAKGEVVEALQDDIERGDIEYVQLPKMFPSEEEPAWFEAR
jgi:uncharacterized protein YhaN